MIEQLEQVGVHTFEKLVKLGSEQAFIRINAIDSSACINRLYALEGAIQGIRWHSLTKEVKNELLNFFNMVKKSN